MTSAAASAQPIIQSPANASSPDGGGADHPHRPVLPAVRRLARLVASELDAATLARSLAGLLLEIFDLSRATVALEEHQRVRFVVTALRGRGRLLEPDEAIATALRSLDGGRRIVLRADDVLSPDHVAPESKPLLDALRAQAESAGDERADRDAALVPVHNHQGRCVGRLLLVTAPDAPFTAHDLELADACADQVSVGIERARVLERLADWTHGLQALLAFSAAINRHREAPVLIRHLVEHAGQFLEAQGGLAGLREERERGPCMVSTAYWTDNAWHDDERAWWQGEGIPGHLLDSEFPCLVDDYRNDPRADEDYRRRYGVRFALSVPIKNSAGQPVGFFELHRGDRQQPFSWQDAAFLESLANTTAVAIENVQLIDQLEIKSRQVRVLSAENVNRQEEERRHISRELHDEAGQALVGIKLGLEVMARRLPQDPDEMREQLALLSGEVNRATQQLKNLAQRIRPPALDRLGLDMALQQLADELSSRGLQVELALSLSPERLPEDVETALFRIAQEALTNTALHARARAVHIALEVDVEGIMLTIADDGVGFEPAAVADDGLGLLGMRERVAMLGGSFHIESGPGTGTHLVVSIHQLLEEP
ncbi:MAG: GAF domain-containing protein [Acidobacteriota bacterium]